MVNYKIVQMLKVFVSIELLENVVVVFPKLGVDSKIIT